VQGAEAARPWLQRAGATFPTVIDAASVLGDLFGYKVIPNGIFLDETGMIRFAKSGGFSVANKADVSAITGLLAARPGASAPAVESRETARMALDGGTRDAALQHGLDLLRGGDCTAAVSAWRAALAGDQDNFVIRKQIWAVEHPERFYPTIDFAWQKEQLARERAARA